MEFNQDGFYDLFPIWDIGSYFFILFNAYPYISLEGFKESGKSKVMALSSLISYNGLELVNLSPASLFRIVDANKSSLYVDEAENLYKRANSAADADASDIVSLLNAGWQKGARVPRQEKTTEGKFKTIFFDVYSPKMIASINGVKGALESRSIKCIMIRTKRDDPRGDLWPEATDTVFLDIRNSMYPVALKNWSEIHSYYQKGSFLELKKEFNIANREWLIWKPLLCIAKLIGDDVYQRLGKFAEEIYENQSIEKIDEESWEIKTLKTLIEMVSDDESYMSVRDIKEVLGTKFNDLEKRPSARWMGWYFKRINLNKKRRTGSGMEYLLSKKIINNVLAHLDLTTLTTETAQTTPNNGVEEEQITEETENTWMPCSVCGSRDESCNYLNKSTGKPICKGCKEGLDVQSCS